MAFGFYHLACMLLAIYKPSPKFAVRGLHSPARESDVSFGFAAMRMDDDLARSQGQHQKNAQISKRYLSMRQRKSQTLIERYHGILSILDPGPTGRLFV